MRKFLFAVAAVLVVAFASAQAAPTLGVSWRAAANAKTPGVTILSVDEGSNAEELGLEVGDVVLSVNDKLVRTGKDATDAVAKANGKLTLLVQDVNGTGLVEITADIDEPTKGIVAGAGGKAKYSNVTRTAKADKPMKKPMKTMK